VADEAAPVTGHRFLNPEGLLPGQGFSHVAVPAEGRLVLLAGQTAHRPDGTVAPGGVAEQMDAALGNLVVALAAAGAVPAHVVRMELYVVDVEGYRSCLAAVGDAWRRHLGRHYPAVSLFGVTTLFDPAALVEIVATAVIPAGP
jgi:enamine deaminase RidA (YjgF/YER057c/UK114 family)